MLHGLPTPSLPGSRRSAGSRFAHAAVLAVLAFPAAHVLPVVGPFLSTQAQAATQVPTLDAMKQTLQSYGRFVTHERYGEVWVPSVTPQGWHPYAPCHWVYTQRLGWYYDDPTPWGRIVHHYGRWAHDASMGWIWVPGEEFSPGWVVWRAGEQWTGWAPMPPQQDVQTISAEAFNNDKHWIFVETAKLGSRCQGESAGQALVSQVPVLIERTRLITQVRFVEGIAVVVIPPPVVISVVNVDIDIFAPWSPVFLGHVFWAWNWIWNNVSIVITVNNTCPIVAPKPVPALKLDSTPPPPPPGQRVEKPSGPVVPPQSPKPPPVRVADPDPQPPPTRVIHPRLPEAPPKRVVPQGPLRQPSGPVILPERPSVIVDPVRIPPIRITEPKRRVPAVTQPTLELPIRERVPIMRTGPGPQVPVAVGGPNRGHVPVTSRPDPRVTMPPGLVRSYPARAVMGERSLRPSRPIF